jgi:bifunctional DNase/RNase
MLYDKISSTIVPIIVGAFEAQAIAIELEGIGPPRPLTHDLIKTILDDFKDTVKEVEIYKLKTKDMIKPFFKNVF